MAGNKHLTPVVLPADPTNPMEAATKQYVDNNSGGGGGGGSIAFIDGGDSTSTYTAGTAIDGGGA